jgi:alkylated DNA repair dioxygenase AlkB
MGALLGERYGVGFTRIGANLYRDGADSVAWHGDRVARELPTATVALVSLGAVRPFRLRPAGGGTGPGFLPGPGDLLVMGGSCQRTWQHAVPKVRAAAPRISVQFRHAHAS